MIVVPQAIPAPVVSRVSDRLGACRPASVPDSSLHVLLKFEIGKCKGKSMPNVTRQEPQILLDLLAVNLFAELNGLTLPGAKHYEGLTAVQRIA